MLFSIFNGNKGILLIDLAGDLLLEKEGSLGLLLVFPHFSFVGISYSWLSSRWITMELPCLH